MTKEIELCELVGAYVICNICGSQDIARDAAAQWDITSGNWSLETVFDAYSCKECGNKCLPIWRLDQEYRRKEVARLNDAVRHGEYGNTTIIATTGVQAMGEASVSKIIGKVSKFDDFSEDNDPHGERDFGSIEINSEKLFWKIDLFDLELKQYSLDPASESLTHRVLTIMLASEY